METLPEKTNRLPQTLPEKRQSAAVLLYSGTAKAIEVRRAMVELPEVAKALTPVEKYIFVASTKKQIAEIDDETLIAKTGQMFRVYRNGRGVYYPNRKPGRLDVYLYPVVGFAQTVLFAIDIIGG